MSERAMEEMAALRIQQSVSPAHARTYDDYGSEDRDLFRISVFPGHPRRQQRREAVGHRGDRFPSGYGARDVSPGCSKPRLG